MFLQRRLTYKASSEYQARWSQKILFEAKILHYITEMLRQNLFSEILLSNVHNTSDVVFIGI